jgi:hypothetical protein
MSIQAFELEYSSGHTGGVVLVCSVTCLPLPLETSALRDLDDADAFVEWGGGSELRKLSVSQLQDLGELWNQKGREEFRARPT